MLIRAIAGCAALVLALLLSPSVSAAPCEGAGCSAAAAKPLDITKFMREQAASTRAGESPRKPRASAKAQPPAHRAVAARPKQVLPTEAAASFAARPERKDQASVQARDEGPVWPSTGAGQAETTGAGVVDGPFVQVVEAQELNDIDRKADERAPLQEDAGDGGGAPAQSPQANTSWLQWIWSALASTFAALTTAVHQLLHL